MVKDIVIGLFWGCSLHTSVVFSGGLGWLYFWATRDFLLIAIFCLEFVFSLCLYSIERIQFELVIKKIQSELTEKKINVKTIVIKRKRTMSIICFLFLF